MTERVNHERVFDNKPLDVSFLKVVIARPTNNQSLNWRNSCLWQMLQVSVYT